MTLAPSTRIGNYEILAPAMPLALPGPRPMNCPRGQCPHFPYRFAPAVRALLPRARSIRLARLSGNVAGKPILGDPLRESAGR